MNIPEEVRSLYRHPGPFATAYLDATRATEHGGEEIADRAGADISAVRAEAAATAGPAEHAEVTGSHAHALHKTSSVDWSERHFQRYVENNRAANAHEVAAEVQRRMARVGATLVVLAGDERARALLRRDLHTALGPEVEIAEVTEGGRADGEGVDRAGPSARETACSPRPSSWASMEWARCRSAARTTVCGA